jgi:hypothetical protein
MLAGGTQNKASQHTLQTWPFFMGQSETPQNAPDGGTVDIDAMRLSQLGHEFIKRDPAFGHDAGFEPADHVHQLAMSAAIALSPRCQTSGLAPQLHQIIDEFRRHPKMPSRLTMSVSFVHIADDPATKLHWMWLAHLKSPSALAEGITSLAGWKC